MAEKRLEQYDGEDIDKYVFVLKEYQFRPGNSNGGLSVWNREQNAYRTPTALKNAILKRSAELVGKPPAPIPSPWFHYGRFSEGRYHDTHQKMCARVKKLLEAKNPNVHKVLTTLNKDARHTLRTTLSYEVLRLRD